jgi:hypothetical protein
MKNNQGWPALFFLAGLLAASCGDGGGGDGDAADDGGPDTRDDAGADVPDGTDPDVAYDETTDVPEVDIQSGCPDRLAPLEPAGQVLVVGDGTAANCTEAALRDAVGTLGAAEGGGTITFDCGGEHTITLTAELAVSGFLMIDGEGAITLSGGGTTRVLNLDNYTDLVVQRLTISGGNTEESGAGIQHPWYGTLKAIDVNFVDNHCTSQAGEIGGGAVFAGGLSEAVFSGCTFAGNSASNGGAILNRGSTLTVVDCVFSGNSATSTGDGQYGNGGGLYIDGMNYDSPGDLRLCGTVFENNHANTHGSGMFSYFYEGSRSFIDRCLFRGNEFDGSPTGGAGGLYHEAVPLTMTNTTIAENRSDQHAAGLFIGSESTAEVTNCTFAGNIVPEVGAAIFDGSSPLAIKNCTFSGNSADYGPAIFKGEGVSISVANSIFAYNVTPNEYSALACHETLEDGGGNIQWPDVKNNGNADNPCAAGITFADPLLQPLADNGGPTPTMALGAGSPAIDVSDSCPETDQRGMPRSGRCDAGAYEYQP